MDRVHGVSAGEFGKAGISLAPEPRSVSRARSFVAAMLETWDCDDPERTVVLLTSEIVTNAVRRATDAIRVEATLVGDEALRVEATDDHPDLPVRHQPDHHDEGGRGILLVQALALRWGVDREEGHKVVWFEAPVTRRAR
ncbi:MAG TPA: ATP-binding protein [Acidimicrobiales bacterium]|jgi:anti-sigma regulatory factor (Ser/Thr protein kinase)